MDKTFFDNAVLKAKEAIDVACKKTGEVVNVQKQRFDIASLESKLEKDLAALGAYWFEQLEGTDMDDVPDEAKALIEEIKAKQEKIVTLREEIAQTKSKKVCPSCQALVDSNAQFCSACGEKLTF